MKSNKASLILVAFLFICPYVQAQKLIDSMTHKLDDTLTVIGLTTTDCVNCYLPVYHWLQQQESRSTTSNTIFLIPETRYAELEKFVAKNIPFYKNYFFLRDEVLYKHIMLQYKLSRPTYYLLYDRVHSAVLSVQNFNTLK